MVTLFPLLFSPHVLRRIFFKTIYNDDLSRKIKMNDPDMGIWQYFYNEFSEMTSQLDARTNTVAFFFDTRGRLTNKSARYGLEDDFVTLAEYEYGTNGYQYNRLVKVIENDGTTGEESYFYDILGTATNISRFISGAGTYQRGFAYDALGRITTVVYPHKADNTEPYTIRYEYHEQNGLLNKISEVDSAGALKTNLLSGISYDHYGRRKVMTYGNEVTTYYSYDALTGLLNNQEVMKNGILQNVNYAFDAAGNVLSKEDTQNGIKHEYGYDDLNRLLSSKLTMTSAEPGQQENYDETFSYDPLGNILTKDKQGGYGYSDYVYTRAHAVESYTYTRNNLGTPEETDVNIEYDANGNMAKKTETTDVISKTTTYEWDIENRLSVVKEGSKVISSYLYDHTGERLKKTANGSSVYYLGGMSQMKADANNSAQHFVFDGVNRIAAAVTKCSNKNDRFWMHTDNIGSTSMITSADGVKIQRLVYKAFGKIHAHWENGSWSLGETALLGGIGFSGQETDDETGLMYYGARYYDAGMGRFISADTIIDGVFDPAGFNRYSYVKNNPINYNDPSGHLHQGDMEDFPYDDGSSDTDWWTDKGDTIDSIAKAWGVTPEEILKANPGLDPTNIQPGTKINKPGEKKDDDKKNKSGKDDKNSSEKKEEEDEPQKKQLPEEPTAKKEQPTAKENTKPVTVTPDTPKRNNGTTGGGSTPAGNTSATKSRIMPGEKPQDLKGGFKVPTFLESVKRQFNRLYGINTVFATREKLLGGTMANNEVVTADDYFVALPSTRAVGRKVEIMYNNLKVTATVKDVGPWNEHDSYWNSLSGRPASEHGNSKSMVGTNGAGIDLSEAVWRDLGMKNNDVVRWRFVD